MKAGPFLKGWVVDVVDVTGPVVFVTASTMQLESEGVHRQKLNKWRGRRPTKTLTQIDRGKDWPQDFCHPWL